MLKVLCLATVAPLYLGLLMGECALAQFYPSQVITLTTGTQGTVERSNRTMNHATQEVFNFSLTTQEKNLEDRVQQASQGQRQQTKNTISAASFSREVGKIQHIESVINSDTYNFLQTSFSQTLSIEY